MREVEAPKPEQPMTAEGVLASTILASFALAGGSAMRAHRLTS